jgi:hypothetical protein
MLHCGAYSVGQLTILQLEEIKYLLGYSAAGGGSFHVVDNLHSNKNTLPHGWESYTMDDVSNHFECEGGISAKSTMTMLARSRSRPLPSLEHWLFLRKQYKEFVDENLLMQTQCSMIYTVSATNSWLWYSLSDH